MDTSEELSMLRSIARSMPRCYGIDIDDYIQTGYLAIMKAEKHYDPGKGASFKTYASRCARNEMLKLLRSESKHSQANICFDESKIAAQNDADFRSFLYDLSPIESRILTSRYHDRYTQAEVARALKITQSTVCRIERNALRKLRA